MTLKFTSCEKPGCSDSAKKTYSGKHDNKVEVCRAHYWQLVTGNPVPKFDTGIGVERGTGGISTRGVESERVGSLEIGVRPTEFGRDRLSSGGSANLEGYQS